MSEPPPPSRKNRRAAEATAHRSAAPSPHVAQLLHAALAHHQAGRLAEAEALYGDALRADPQNADALHLSGLIAHQRGDSARAVALISEALKHGDAPNCRYNLALALDGADRLDEARTAYERVLELEPDRAAAHGGLAAVLLRLGETERAGTHFRRAVALAPGAADAHNNLANFLAHQGKRDEAIEQYRRAIALDPSLAEAQYNLGALLRDAGRSAEAEPHLRRAIALDPRHAAAWQTLGLVMQDLGRPDDALGFHERALELRPGDADTLNTLGNAHKQLGRFHDAIHCYTRALEAAPNNGSARVNRALTRLMQWQFAGGWRDYQRRTPLAPADATTLTRDALPDLAGKRVLVFNDQGFGDELFFMRFAPELKRQGASVIYRASSTMAPLFARLPFLDAVVDQGEPAADIRLSIGDLPFLLGHADAAHTPQSIQIPPLPERVATLRARLAATGPLPYIGLTWRAGVQQRNSLSKIVPLERLAAAFAPLDATVIALQRNPLPGEIEQLSALIGRPAHDFTALNDDLEDMLALMSLLDDYVAVSNTNVHLRAATERTSRILVPFPPEYRWGLEGGSPWFRGTSVYREGFVSGWNPALKALGAGLRMAFPAGT
jgi:tetratricopeptide (TPR) repeat protein